MLTNLIDVIVRYGVVERTVEIIQQFHDLYRRTFRRQRCEPDNIREVDRGARIHLRSHITSRLQLIRNKTTQQRLLVYITMSHCVTDITTFTSVKKRKQPRI